MECRKVGLKSPDSLPTVKKGKAKYMSTLSKKGYQMRMRGNERSMKMREDVKQ